MSSDPELKALESQLKQEEEETQKKKEILKKIFKHLEKLIIERNALLWLYYLSRDHIINNLNAFKRDAERKFQNKMRELQISKRSKKEVLPLPEKSKFIEDFIFRSFTQLNKRTQKPQFNLDIIFNNPELLDFLPKRSPNLQKQLLVKQKMIEEKIKEYLTIGGFEGAINLESLPLPINNKEEFTKSTETEKKSKPKKPWLSAKFTKKRKPKGGRKTKKTLKKKKK